MIINIKKYKMHKFNFRLQRDDTVNFIGCDKMIRKSSLVAIFKMSSSSNEE